MNKECKICGTKKNTYLSPLFEEIVCDSCAVWAIKSGITSRINVAKQYEEYVKSFPLNDPRD